MSDDTGTRCHATPVNKHVPEGRMGQCLGSSRWLGRCHWQRTQQHSDWNRTGTPRGWCQKCTGMGHTTCTKKYGSTSTGSRMKTARATTAEGDVHPRISCQRIHTMNILPVHDGALVTVRRTREINEQLRILRVVRAERGLGTVRQQRRALWQLRTCHGRIEAHSRCACNQRQQRRDSKHGTTHCYAENVPGRSLSVFHSAGFHTQPLLE